MNDAKRRSGPPRIGFVDQTGGLAGGAERSLALLLRHLPNTFDARVILFSDGEYADGLRASGLHVTIVDLPDDLLQVQRESVSLRSIGPAFSAVSRLRKALRDLEIDVVYTHSVKSHFLAGIAAKSLGIPAVTHLRDILTGNARLLLRSIVLATTVHRVAISRAVARAYELPDTTIILNPIDLADYAHPAPRDQARARLNLPLGVPIVGVIGRINRWKRQDAFLRVARIVADKTPAHFAIVGAAVFRDSEFVGELHALASELGIADRVHFVPWLSDPRDAFASLDVHANTSEREPFGRTIIEAAAVGVPTISFDDGGAEDAVSPNLACDIVRGGDLDAFAAAVLRYLEDPILLKEAGREAIAFSRTFDASEHADRVGAMLSGVVARSTK